MNTVCNFISSNISIQCNPLNAISLGRIVLLDHAIIGSVTSEIVDKPSIAIDECISVLKSNVADSVKLSTINNVLGLNLDTTKPIALELNSNVTVIDSNVTRPSIIVERVDKNLGYFNASDGKFFTFDGYRILIWS